MPTITWVPAGSVDRGKAAVTPSPGASKDKGEGKPRRAIKTFEERLDELTTYKAKNGHVRVKKSEDKSLAQFCEGIRGARRGTGGRKLTKEGIASLDALGFVWEPKRQHAFERRLEELKAYKAEHGHLNVKKGEGKSLHKFCVDSRYARRNPESRKGRKLTADRIAALSALGFDWEVMKKMPAPPPTPPCNPRRREGRRSSGASKDEGEGKPRRARKTFEERLQQLTAYSAKHGHVNVKGSEDKSLARFCESIRSARRGIAGRNLVKERIASLDALGFEWGVGRARSKTGSKPLASTAPAASKDEGGGKQRRVIKTFEERLQELKAYKEEHGHLKVKESEDKSLAKFCVRVRQARRNPGRRRKPTKEEIASLNELGFDWAPQSNGGGRPFEERLEELKAYRTKHGHINVKKSEDKSLADFCNNIRCARRNPGRQGGVRLTEDRIASLDALEFDWEAKRRRRKKKIPPATLPIVIHNREPFGAEVGSETTGEGRRFARIVNVVAGSQAEMAGLRAGDLPVSDGWRLSYDVFLQMVKGGVRPFTFQVYRRVNTQRTGDGESDERPTALSGAHE